MKDNVIAAFVNELTACAIQYGRTQQIRINLRSIVIKYLAGSNDMPFNNDLTPAEQERLEMLAEEASEVIKCCMKILRHGYESVNPNIHNGPTNRKELIRELGDMQAVVWRMTDGVDFEQEDIDRAATAKSRVLGHYTHHQPTGSDGLILTDEEIEFQKAYPEAKPTTTVVVQGLSPDELQAVRSGLPLDHVSIGYAAPKDAGVIYNISPSGRIETATIKDSPSAGIDIESVIKDLNEELGNDKDKPGSPS